MAIFLASTTGAGTVTIDDLGEKGFTHPIVNEDLTDEFEIEELRASLDLRAAIDAGDLIATLDGVAITTGVLFDSIVEDFLNKRVADAESDIITLQDQVSVLEGNNKHLKVIAIVDNTAVPPTEVNGDRYALDNTGTSNAAWDGAVAMSVVEFNSTSGLWEETTTTEGDKVFSDTANEDYRHLDDGTAVWEVLPHSDDQNATEVPYTPSTASDWDVTPTEVKGALDEAASRIEDLENAATSSKKSWSYEFGENGNLSSSRNLKRTGGMVGNLSPAIALLASTIHGITITSKQGTNATFDIQVFKNGSSILTESISAADKKVNAGLSLALIAGDEVYVRFVKTSGNVRDINVNLYLQES